MTMLSRRTQLVPSTPALGLALGGGGAKGLAHIVALEVFDEMGLRPAMISGCSMGAIIGAAYASGLSGKDMRAYVSDIFSRKTDVMRRLMMARVGKLTDLFKTGFTNPVLVDAEMIIRGFLPNIIPARFEDLLLPFSCVAVDFHSHSLVRFDKGPLLPAIAASIAIPGLIKPVRYDGRILIDGGILNAVPIDCLPPSMIRIGVDVLDGSSLDRDLDMGMPGAMDALFGSVTLMMQAMIAERLKVDPPSLLLLPPTGKFRVLDFFRYEEIFRACEPFKDEIKRKITRLLGSELAVVQKSS